MDITFDKDVDDIAAPLLLEEDWYPFIINGEPKLEDNKKAKDGLGPEDGAGKNLVVRFKLVSDDPKINGRIFTGWLPYPLETDKDRYDGLGNNLYDKSMQRIACLANCAKGSVVDGRTATITPNSEVMAYVTKGLDQEGVNIVNSLDVFRDPPFKAVE